MLLTEAALFQLISARMSWLSQRQAVLSQNIPNADPPDYRPKDPRAADFVRLVHGFAGRPGSLALTQTERAHSRMRPRLGWISQCTGAPAERNSASAHDRGVPIVRKLPLARARQGALELGLEVAPAHCRAVVELIGYGLRISHRS